MLRNGFLTFFLLIITAKESIQLCEESVTLDSPIVNSVVDNAGSFCNPYQRTYSRAIEGRTVFRADSISVTPARCNVSCVSNEIAMLSKWCCYACSTIIQEGKPQHTE